MSNTRAAITLDMQAASEHCPECNVKFPVIRGSVYDEGEPFGLYLIALHGHCPQGRLAHLAIAVLDHSGTKQRPIAASIDVIAEPEQIGFSLIDWQSSPWRNEVYLGQMLSPEQVNASPHRATFFDIAEHVVQDLPDVRAYLA
jgi:hypothetical protein